MRSAPISSANAFRRARYPGGGHDVARRALDGLDDDRGDVVRRLVADLLAQEARADEVAVGVASLERTAVAVGVRARVEPGVQRAEAVLEVVAEQPEDAPRLAVEAAPEAEHLGAAGARARQPHRRLDRLGAAAVELRAAQVARGDLGEQRASARRGARS